MLANLQQGPTGCWQGMVVSNIPEMHPGDMGGAKVCVRRVMVLFWNLQGAAILNTFYWNSGTMERVI